MYKLQKWMSLLFLSLLLTGCGGSASNNEAPETTSVELTDNELTIDDITIDVQYNQATTFTLFSNRADNSTIDVTFPADLQGAQIVSEDAQTLQFIYTPAANSIESKTYTLSASDGQNSTEFLLSVNIIDTSPATVIAVTPLNDNGPVLLDSAISIMFSDIMQTSSLSVNTRDGECKGSVQLSSDDFNSCLALSINNIAGTTEDTTTYFHSISLTALLAADKLYTVRVTDALVNFSSIAMTAQQVVQFSTSSLDLKISEISSMQYSNDLPWVEIYNGTGKQVNLANYALKAMSLNSANNTFVYDHIYTLPNKILENGAYLILQSRFGDDFLTDAATNNPKIVLIGDSSDEIRPYWYTNGYVELLTGDQSSTVDFVRFGNSAQVPITLEQWLGDNAEAMINEQGYSLKRNLVVQDTNKAADWNTSLFSTPAGQNDITCVDDTDKDGIPDCSELPGTTFGGLPLYDWGARVSQKDIFIEVDYMDSSDAGITPHRTSLDKVASVFSEKGYTVHFDVGDLYDQNTGINSDNYDLGGGNVVHFNAYTPYDYDKSSANLFSYKMQYSDITRRPIFHYLLMANSGNEDGSASGSGIAEVDGNDLMLTMGNWGLSLNSQPVSNVTYNYQAATIVHELGHNLGLLHGGDEDVNYKPNHFSSMNYLYQLSGIATPGNNEGDRYYKHFFDGNSSCGSQTLTNDKTGPTSLFVIGYSEGLSGNIDESDVLESDGFKNTNSDAVDLNCNALFTDHLNDYDVNQDTLITQLTDVNEWALIDLQFYTKTSGNRFGLLNTVSNKSSQSQTVAPVLINNTKPTHIIETQPNAALFSELKMIKEGY